MLKLRVPVNSFQILTPTTLQNKTLTSGFNGTAIPAVLQHVLNGDNIKTGRFRSMLPYHQRIHFTFAERQAAFTKTFRMYSTDTGKEKKIHQKNVNKVKKVISNNPEVRSLKLEKITILNKSVQKPDVSISAAFPIQIQTPQIHNVFPINRSVTQTVDIGLKSDSLATSTERVPSLEYKQQVNYADLSLVVLPLSLHHAEESVLLAASIQDFRHIHYSALSTVGTWYLLAHQQGKLWCTTAQEALRDPRTFQEFLRQGNLTTRSIANKLSTLLTNKDAEKGTGKVIEKGTEKVIEKSIEKGAEKATEKGTEKGAEKAIKKGTEKDVETSKSAVDSIVDKVKGVVASLVETVQKLMKKK